MGSKPPPLVESFVDCSNQTFLSKIRGLVGCWWESQLQCLAWNSKPGELLSFLQGLYFSTNVVEFIIDQLLIINNINLCFSQSLHSWQVSSCGWSATGPAVPVQGVLCAAWKKNLGLESVPWGPISHLIGIMCAMRIYSELMYIYIHIYKYV